MIEATFRRLLDLTLWIYRNLFCFYPREFRGRFEQEMLQLIRTELRQRRADASQAVLATLWIHWIPDLLAAALRERIAQPEGKMRISRFVLNGVAFAILFTWFVFVGLSEAKYFLRLPIQDPTRWLLGESFTSLAFNSLNGFLTLGPLAALGFAIYPFFRVGRGSKPGELLEIRIQQPGGASLALLLGSGLASAFILASFVLSRVY
jgi:hypothetical protein